jgi:hypothetical protein
VPVHDSLRDGGILSERLSGSAGFSLMEVLAALVVTMLLVLALTPFVGQMLATWTRGSEAAKLVEWMTRGVGVLRSDLRHAVLWTGNAQGQTASPFRGGETSLSFLSATGLGPGRDGLQTISISVEPSADGRALVRRSAPAGGAGQGGFGNPVVLMSGRFSYGFKFHARKGEAMSAWTDPRELPVRVELSIVAEGGRLFRAPLEFPVLASLSAACLATRGLPGCPNGAPQQQDIEKWNQSFGYSGD